MRRKWQRQLEGGGGVGKFGDRRIDEELPTELVQTAT